MNYFSHLWVVERNRHVPAAVALGVVLPDVLAMAGIRADQTRLPPAVRAGRDAHHRGDHLFHRHPTFLRLVSQLRRALSDAGLGAGPAHAVAHAGTELLLDGTLVLDGTLARAPLVEAFTEALARAELVHPALAAADRPRFDEVVRRTAQDRPERLADAGAVADRLFRVVGRRPRLSFAPEQTATVARILSAHRPALVSAGAGMLRDVAADLGDVPGEVGPADLGDVPAESGDAPEGSDREARPDGRYGGSMARPRASERLG